MEEWVAVEVRTASGQSGFFVTWGRIQDALDPVPLETLVLQAAANVSMGSPPISARVCPSLSAAAALPYFFEGLLGMAGRPIPYGDGYETWKRERALAMAEGREIYFVGLQPE